MFRFLRHWPVFVVGGLVAFSACQSDNNPMPQVVQSVRSEVDERLLDYIEKSGEAIEDVQRRVESIELVSGTAIERNESRQRELNITIGEYQSYDTEVWSLFDRFILAKSFELFDEAQDAARAQNMSIEWALQRKATHIKDQLWTLSSPSQGNIAMQDGPDRDKFSDALTDAMAMSALLGQIMSGDTPAYAQVNANELVIESESLAKALYTMAALNIPLRSASDLPQIEPAANLVEAGVQDD